MFIPKTFGKNYTNGLILSNNCNGDKPRNFLPNKHRPRPCPWTVQVGITRVDPACEILHSIALVFKACLKIKNGPRTGVTLCTLAGMF